MDLDALIDLIKNFPLDKQNDDDAIKSVFQQAAQGSGRSYTDEELNQFLLLFKQLLQDDSQSKLISMLIKGGMNKNQMDEIKEKLDS
ncbi:hypothetical protein ACQCN2_12805 [Brevibacillus ginsengisoli]|uniref:hypothetical protein n=1 Tax=Brevibacillus ginsengisoli TaxID=363854 RepID=UPI003CF21CB9